MTMAFVKAVFLLLSVTLVIGQRPSFAGTKPIGFPELQNKTTTTADGLGNRFGDGATTPKLPLEALGDKDLVDRQNQLPEDNRLFWVLNAQALEANRQNPQVYPQRPNIFAQPLNTQSPVNLGSSTPQNVNTESTVSRNSVLGTNKPVSQLINKFSATSTSGNTNYGFTTQPVPQTTISNRSGETKQKANLYGTQ